MGHCALHTSGRKEQPIAAGSSRESSAETELADRVGDDGASSRRPVGKFILMSLRSSAAGQSNWHDRVPELRRSITSMIVGGQ